MVGLPGTVGRGFWSSCQGSRSVIVTVREGARVMVVMMKITPYGEAQANRITSKVLKTTIVPDFFFE